MRDIDARRLTREKKDRILARDANLCGYCADDADEVDHVIPWSWRHDDSDENLIAACWLCNSIAGNKVFNTVVEKKAHILRRKERIIKGTVIAIWTDDELVEMGPAMRKYIHSNCIIAVNHAEALHLSRRLRAVGLEVRIGG